MTDRSFAEINAKAISMTDENILYTSIEKAIAIDWVSGSYDRLESLYSGDIGGVAKDVLFTVIGTPVSTAKYWARSFTKREVNKFFTEAEFGKSLADKYGLTDEGMSQISAVSAGVTGALVKGAVLAVESVAVCVLGAIVGGEVGDALVEHFGGKIDVGTNYYNMLGADAFNFVAYELANIYSSYFSSNSAQISLTSSLETLDPYLKMPKEFVFVKSAASATLAAFIAAGTYPAVEGQTANFMACKEYSIVCLKEGMSQTAVKWIDSASEVSRGLASEFEWAKENIFSKTNSALAGTEDEAQIIAPELNNNDSADIGYYDIYARYMCKAEAAVEGGVKSDFCDDYVHGLDS